VVRRIFKEQIRKELLDEIKKYRIGLAYNGEMMVGNKPFVNGYLFIIPDEKYQELFRE